jgi:hypothetical protein
MDRSREGKGILPALEDDFPPRNQTDKLGLG